MLGTIYKNLSMIHNDYFRHNLDFIERAWKKLRPQNTDDETVQAAQSDYVWFPEWSHESFFSFPTDISNQAIHTITFDKNYLRVYLLTVDATPLK